MPGFLAVVYAEKHGILHWDEENRSNNDHKKRKNPLSSS
jgi:hypothetical protein